MSYLWLMETLVALFGIKLLVNTEYMSILCVLNDGS